MRMILMCLVLATTMGTAQAGVFDPHCGQDTYIQESLDENKPILPIEGAELTGRNKEICDQRFNDRKKYHELAEKYGVSEPRIGDICRKEADRRKAVALGTGVSMRAYSILKRLKVTKIGELRSMKLSRIKAVPGAGVKVVDEIVDLAKRHNITLE